MISVASAGVSPAGVTGVSPAGGAGVPSEPVSGAKGQTEPTPAPGPPLLLLSSNHLAGGLFGWSSPGGNQTRDLVKQGVAGGRGAWPEGRGVATNGRLKPLTMASHLHSEQRVFTGDVTAGQLATW